MGRHSAGDDEDEGTDVRLAAPAVQRPSPRGRHSRAEDVADGENAEAVEAGQDARDTGPVARTVAPDEQPTERIGLADLLAAAEEDAEPSPHPASAEPALELRTIFEEPAAAPAKPPASKRPARGNQSTAADLELLRKHSDVRARVIAAVVVPFVLYAAVLLLIGARAVQFLIFSWIPLVSAGVLAGLFLDAAHKRARAEPSDGSSGDGPG